jgi:hypothetical protein
MSACDLASSLNTAVAATAMFQDGATSHEFILHCCSFSLSHVGFNLTFKTDQIEHLKSRLALLDSIKAVPVDEEDPVLDLKSVKKSLSWMYAWCLCHAKRTSDACRVLEKR